MSTPQQPEIARSMRSEVTAEVASKTKAETLPVDEPGAGGPIPEDNVPGHHPEHDQDKPEGPPPRPGVRKPKGQKEKAEVIDRQAAAGVGTRRFGFAFEPKMVPFSLAVGVTPLTAWAEVDGRELRVRFGPWSARTPLENITSAEVTGPYSFRKVAGPAHLSFADGGATFATTTRKGVCLQFHEPIPALFPLGLLRHSGLTLTVDDPDAFVHEVTPTE